VEARRRSFGATPDDLFPLSAAAQETMASYITADQYGWALQRMLDGIAALQQRP
jgi:hypothetical protein